MENQTVVDLCGEYPDDFKKQDIASNPNFVFENVSKTRAATVVQNFGIPDGAADLLVEI